MMIATTCCVLHTCDGFNVPDIRNRDRWKVSVTMNQALARMRLKGLNPLVPSAFRGRQVESILPHGLTGVRSQGALFLGTVKWRRLSPG